MVWRWFRDWRERRATFKEVNKRQREDESYVARDDLNPLHLARLAVEREMYEGAAARWEEARKKLPNFIYESEDSIPVLLGLKRYEEAEALMAEGQRRSPRDRRWLTGLARIAEHRGDYADAARRWKAVQAGGIASNQAWIREGACLRQLGRTDEAEVVFDRAIRRDPTDIGAWVEHAKISGDRKDWQESVARWRVVTERFKIGGPHAALARALVELDQIDEAEAILAQAFAVYPADLEIAVTRSHVAERRGDLATACGRWADLQRVQPYFRPGYSERAKCLVKAERNTEADTVMRNAIERFPDEDWPLLEFASLAHARGDWEEAIPRWESFRARFPDREEGYMFGRDALHAVGRHQESEALRR
jgi:tetratricopeptide (TPR) repeat protein